MRGCTEFRFPPYSSTAPWLSSQKIILPCPVIISPYSLHTPPLIPIPHIQCLPSLLLILHNLNIQHVLSTTTILHSRYVLNKFTYTTTVSNYNSPVYRSWFVLHWQSKAAVNLVKPDMFHFIWATQKWYKINGYWASGNSQCLTIILMPAKSKKTM